MVPVFLASPSRESLTLTYENGLYGSLNWIIAFRRWMDEETDYYRSVDENENGENQGKS